MTKIYFIIFIYFLLFFSSSYAAKIKVLPFMELSKDDEYTYTKEQLSIGVSYSVGGLLKSLPSYEIDYEYDKPNYEIGNLDDAIKNNIGYDIYLWVFYKKKGETVSYYIKSYDSNKKELFSFKVDGNIDNTDDVFNIIDNIVIGVARRLLNISGDLGFGALRLSFEGTGNKTYKVYINGKEAFIVSNDIVKNLRLLSGIEYWVAISIVEENGNKKNVYDEVIKLSREESKEIIYRASGEIIIEGDEKGYKVVLDNNFIQVPYKGKILGNANHKLEIFRSDDLIYSEEFYLEDGQTIKLYPFMYIKERNFSISVGFGNKGVINIGSEIYITKSFRLGFGTGISILKSYTIIPIGNLYGEARYYIFKFSRNFLLDSSLGIGTSFTMPEFGFTEVISFYTSAGVEWRNEILGNLFLDLGGGGGINVRNGKFVLTPYFNIGIRF